MSFRPQPGFPSLHVLDSTDPAQVSDFERKIDPAKTLFIVSSKSGTTLEPNILKQYFFERAAQALGHEAVGRNFIAITDPGSKLQQIAERDRFRRVYFGVPSIGGRYSVLSDFGMAPAATSGIDVRRLLGSACKMVRSCAATVPPADNPGVLLGVIMGVLATHGRDKMTIVAPPGIADFGAWAEQLIAESTGKSGKGLIPVDAEPLGPPAVYGEDRLFAYLRLDAEPDPAQDAAIDALERAGQPVVRIALAYRYQIGQEERASAEKPSYGSVQESLMLGGAASSTSDSRGRPPRTCRSSAGASPPRPAVPSSAGSRATATWSTSTACR